MVGSNDLLRLFLEKTYVVLVTFSPASTHPATYRERTQRKDRERGRTEREGDRENGDGLNRMSPMTSTS